MTTPAGTKTRGRRHSPPSSRSPARPVRFLLATPYFAPAYAFGGPVRVSEVMVADLVAAGHEVTVVTTDAMDRTARIPADAPAEPAGAEILRFRNVSHRIAATAMGWSPRGYVTWIRRNVARFDLVLLHDVYSVISVAAARAASRASVPYVMQPFGSLAPTPERGRPLLKPAFFALWGRATVRGAAAMIHSTEHEGKEFLALGATPSQLLHLPLPLDLPPPAGEPLAPEPTLVSVSRLDPIKGIDRLLKAVAAARPAVAGLRLDLVGPGDGYRVELEQLARHLQIEGAVRFHGFVEPGEKVRLLERAHAFALLSHSEGLPVSALEAMGCGTPVILSTGCHLGEVDGWAGIVVSGAANDAAAAISGLLGDEPRRQRLAAGAVEFAAGFRRGRVMPAMIAELEAIAARRGTS